MQNDNYKEVISKYIKENTFKEASLIKDDTLIFQEGFFDSMGFVMLIDYIEENCKIKTNDSDLIEENFQSINAINDFVIRKLNGSN
jgi:acyl carrier protein